MNKIQLSDHFDYSRLIRFTLPSILMTIFTSIYGMVDGFFVSNCVGKTAFAAVNLIIPALQVLGGIGAMLGVGGSALVAVTLGSGDEERANRYFTMMIRLMFIAGVLFSLLGLLFVKRVAYLFGATDSMIGDCMTYGVICLLFNTALHAQYTFQNYLVVAEKPRLGLVVVLLAGFTNMFLDYLFMAVFHWGVAGAALATGLSQCVGGGIPLVWFLSPMNKSHLHFRKTRFEPRNMAKACVNGSSEMLSMVSASITGILYNRQLMRFAGEDGVAAYGVVMYASFVFIGVYMGYSSGSSPVMGYHYGAGHHKEMRNILKKSLILLGSAAIAFTLAAMALSRTFASIFVGYDAALADMTAAAFKVCAIPFFFMWLNIYASSFFTALNDGVISAVISSARSLFFPVVCILLLPEFFGIDGVWYSLVMSETLGIIVSLFFLFTKQKKYGY